MMDNELATWLGPALDDMTDEQREQISDEAEKIAARYPEADQADEREHALSVAVELILDDATLESIADELVAARVDVRTRAEIASAAAELLATARAREARALVASQQAALMMIASGGSQSETARTLGVDRMTVRSWLGLR